ncbi:DUF4118 domain-containing protein [Streptomyces sp. NBC_01351]|uniref:DUF4118 domain-containing protein n=1 Tax=Streptomyces sp. NBC_01351 TaxID=2903833 RepID=UPI002E313C7E|nr:DUF4118 domain-containing protein [Streptomyces sp. NBC_01351]
MPRYLVSDRVALIGALVLPFLVALALVPFRSRLAETNEALILVVAIVLVAARGTRLAGALAAVSAAAWFDFFLTRPYQRFTITDPDDIQTAVLLLVVGLLVAQLAVRVRRLEVVTVTDADHLSRLHATARLAQRAGSPEAVVDRVRGDLTELLELRGCRFEYGSLLGRPPRLEHDGSVSVGHRAWDLERNGWPEGEIELRASGNGHYYGRFMLAPTPGSVPSVQARRVAATLADLTGSALDTALPGEG